MSTENTSPPKTSFGRRLLLAFKGILRFLARLLLTLIIVGAIGAAVYFGGPVLIHDYLLRDVDINRSHIRDLSTQLEQNSNFFNQRLDDLQTHLEVLEIQSDSDKQTIDDLQARLAAAEETLKNQTVSLESLDALQAALDEYSATLEAQMAGYEAGLEAVQSDVSALSQSATANATELQALNARMQTQDILGTLRQELELLKAMELITRARVSIGQENIGLAKDDLQAANDLLTALRADVPVYQAAYLSEVAQRLELAAQNLTESPSLAYQDLEVAWQLLLGGLPEEPSAGDPAEVDSPTPTPTPTPNS